MSAASPCPRAVSAALSACREFGRPAEPEARDGLAREAAAGQILARALARPPGELALEPGRGPPPPRHGGFWPARPAPAPPASSRAARGRLRPPARSTASGKDMLASRMTKPITSPWAPQPKQWKKPLSSLTVKEGRLLVVERAEADMLPPPACQLHLAADDLRQGARGPVTRRGIGGGRPWAGGVLQKSRRGSH